MLLNILIKLFDYIDTWGETSGYIPPNIGAYRHYTIEETLDQYVFGIEMKLKIESILY